MLRRDSDATSLATGESVSRVNSSTWPQNGSNGPHEWWVGSLFRPSGTFPGTSQATIKLLFSTLLCPFLAPAWLVLGEAHTIIANRPFRSFGKAQNYQTYPNITSKTRLDFTTEGPHVFFWSCPLSNTNMHTYVDVSSESSKHKEPVPPGPLGLISKPLRLSLRCPSSGWIRKKPLVLEFWRLIGCPPEYRALTHVQFTFFSF